MMGTVTAVHTAAVAKGNDPADGVDAELIGRLGEQARAAELQLTGARPFLPPPRGWHLEVALMGN